MSELNAEDVRCPMCGQSADPRLLKDIDALVRNPYLSYNETVRRIGELVGIARNDGGGCA